jgi:hypothetical protein
MRLSLVSLNAARRGAAVFVVVAAWTKVSIPSPNDSVDQRKAPSRQSRIGALARRRLAPAMLVTPFFATFA